MIRGKEETPGDTTQLRNHYESRDFSLDGSITGTAFSRCRTSGTEKQGGEERLIKMAHVLCNEK